MNKNEFEQLFSIRNADLTDKLATLYISQVRGTLATPPYCYSLKIAKDVAEGIIKNGDKLMSNALAESDNEDDDLDAINQTGDDFKAIVPLTLLELTLNDNIANDVKKILYKMYPTPYKGFHITKARALQFSTALKQIKDFLKMHAFQGLTATIALLADSNEDGVVFGNNQTIPINILEEQIKIINTCQKQLTPMIIDIIYFNKNAIYITSLKPNDQTEKFTII